jgi:outer membrane immunogenic protein
MKKITSIIVIVFLVSYISNAQAPIEQGEKQINAGVGLSTFGLPLYAGLEIGLDNNISVGGELSYRKYTRFSSWNPSIITVAGLANYHFNEILDIPSEWNLYAGVTAGYSIWSYSGTSSALRAGRSRIFLAGQVGGRYYLSDNFAINVELGGGTYSGGKFGITFII